MAGASMNGVGSLLSSTEQIRKNWMYEADVVYTVGANADYAVYVEFGTDSQQAQPYLRPAAQKVEQRLERLAGDAASLEQFVKLASFEAERIAKEEVPVDTGNLRASIRTQKLS